MYKYCLMIITISTFIGFIYGMFRFFRDRSALYLRMIILGIGCAMLGRLFELLRLIVAGQLGSGFQVGMLGIIGSFLFFFTANYGQMDSLVDDGSRQFRKYRVIGNLAALGVFAMYGAVIWIRGITDTTVALGVQSVVTALASYYHLKHLVITDVDYGLIKSIRYYNLLALIYAYLCMAEMILEGIPGAEMILTAIFILQSAVMLAVVPVLERGVKKWTT